MSQQDCKVNAGSLDTTGYKNIGCANGWLKEPEEIVKCKGTPGCFPVKVGSTGRCMHRYACPKHQVVYSVDSSD